MRKPDIIRSLKTRFSRERWLSILAFLILLFAWRIFEGESPSEYLHFLAVILALGYLYALAPIPWQWTGDGRYQAPLLQGLLQAIVMNSLLLIPIVWCPVWLAPTLLLGKDFVIKMAQEGHAVANHELAALIYRHAIFYTLLVGGLLGRDEANRVARQEAEATRRDLEAAARQAQTQALQSQLDPHVLYNALSGISELIHENPDRAEKAVLGLSQLYRQITDMGKRDRVTLIQERELVAQYLELEQLRLGDRLRASWDWPAELNAQIVPPLLYQPLVENAVKHGLSPREAGGELILSARLREDDMLVLSVANDGLPLALDWRPGTGLSNLEARLLLLGGSRLNVYQEGGWVRAEVELGPEART